MQNLCLRDQAAMPTLRIMAHPAATGTRVDAMSCEGGTVEGETLELNAGPSTSFETWTVSSVTSLSTTPFLSFVFSSSSFVVSGWYCLGGRGGKGDGKLGKLGRLSNGGRIRPPEPC